MRRFFTLILLTAIYCHVNSQELSYEAPDYDLIRTEIQDSTSSFYYPKLMSRLEAFDTTLCNDDYRHLYYGYIYHKDYEAYWKSPDLDELLKYYRSKKIKKKDYDEIINLATHSISEFPFDLRQMNYLGYIYHLKGDEQAALEVSYRFNATIEAILSTGDGTTCESGFHVISTSHEYVILNMFEFQVTSQALMGECDYLELVKDERDIDGIYFNIEKLFDHNLKKIEARQKQVTTLE